MKIKSISVLSRGICTQAAKATRRQLIAGNKRYKSVQSRSMHTLTEEELISYHRDGYIVVRGNLSPSSVEKYNQHFLDIVNGKVKVPPTTTMLKDISLSDRKNAVMQERTITKIQNFQDVPSLFSYCQEEAVLRNMKRILGEDLYSIHTMFINKPSDLGSGSSRHPPHQDYLYFPFAPEVKMAAAWTALEAITVENGCLYVYPGTHRLPLLPHGYPKDGVVNLAYHGIHDLPTDITPINVEMGPGDTAYFHPLLIHGSGPNNANRYRKAISCHYAASDITVIDVSKTLQFEVTSEVERVFLKSRGFACKYSDIFRFKSRHVAGRRSTTIELPFLWRAMFLARLLAGRFLK